MGSSASVAVTCATVVPVGGRGGTQSQRRLQFHSTRKQSDYATVPQGLSVWLRGERWKWKSGGVRLGGGMLTKERCVCGGGALAALAFHNLGAGVRDNLSSPVATSHYPPAPRFSLFDSVLPLRLSPLLPPLTVSFALTSLASVSSLCPISISSFLLCLLHTNGWGFFLRLPPLPHFYSLSQIHHDLWWVRYYAAGDYI